MNEELILKISQDFKNLNFELLRVEETHFNTLFFTFKYNDIKLHLEYCLAIENEIQQDFVIINIYDRDKNTILSDSGSYKEALCLIKIHI